MKNGKLRNYLKILLVAILILPCVIAFKGCSCSKNDGGNKTSSNVTHTVIFYTGNPDKFNIPKQEIKDGGKVTRPDTKGWRYYNTTNNTVLSFDAWYSDPSLDIRYVWKFDTDQVYSDITLYAKWNEISTDV